MTLSLGQVMFTWVRFSSSGWSMLGCIVVVFFSALGFLLGLEKSFPGSFSAPDSNGQMLFRRCPFFIFPLLCFLCVAIATGGSFYVVPPSQVVVKNGVVHYAGERLVFFTIIDWCIDLNHQVHFPEKTYVYAQIVRPMGANSSMDVSLEIAVEGDFAAAKQNSAVPRDFDTSTNVQDAATGVVVSELEKTDHANLSGLIGVSHRINGKMPATWKLQSITMTLAKSN